MTNTPEEIKKLILQARSFTPVNLTAQSGATINVQLGYGSVRATALTPVAGNAIAFQTDQGNWYVIGESSGTIENNGESKRQISYRVVRPKPDLAYPVKTIFGIRNRSTFTYLGYYLGGDRNSKLLNNQIPNNVFLSSLQITNYGKNRFNIYGINSYGFLTDPSPGDFFVIVDDKEIKIANNNPNTTILSGTYSGNKLLLSYGQNTQTASLPLQGIIKNNVTNYEYSRSALRPVIVHNPDNPENYPYGWTYFNDPQGFSDEYEYDLEIGSYFEETPTTLTMSSSHLITRLSVLTASPVQAIKGDDLIWRTGFFLSGNPINRSIITNKESTYIISGESTVIYTVDGYINQEYEASMTFKEGYKQRYLSVSNSFYWALDDVYLVPQETKNIITLHYGNKEIILNSNDFFCTRLNYYFYEKPEVGATFDFLFHNIGGKQSSGVDLNLSIFENNNYIANVYYYDEETEEDTYFLIKGELLGATPTTGDPDIYFISCNITFVKEELTSFADHLILDNGSLYNFLFRKSFGSELSRININDRNYQSAYLQGLFLIYSEGWYTPSTEGATKTNMSFLFLDQNFATLLLSTYYTNGHRANRANSNFTGYLNDFFSTNSKGVFDVISKGMQHTNIIKNEIYCVVKTEKNKAWIEQWDIKDNGDVKYNKVFQVDYAPLKKPNEENNEQLIVFAHSYYPT